MEPLDTPEPLAASTLQAALLILAQGQVDKVDVMRQSILANQPSPQATLILGAIAISPPAPQLYRGIAIVPSEDELPIVGQTLAWCLASCSSSLQSARAFMHSELGALQDYDSHAVGVIYQVLRASHALDLAGISEYPSEQEWLTHGRFLVEQVTNHAGQYRIVVRQIAVR